MLTLQKEKRFVVLVSVDDLGGRGTKSAVLDNILDRGYVHLKDKDIAIMPSRNEPFWRNDFAFVRKHLVQARALNGTEFNSWTITEQGREYLVALAADVAGAPRHRILTMQGLERAMHHRK